MSKSQVNSMVEQSVHQKATDYDVIIAGGGWAGLTLARQLKRESKDVRILILEAATEFMPKVGEATVEITGHYFLKKLGLANYMYRRQLPKNGLRFFYDTPTHDLEIEQMSEHGTTSIPPHPAFQLDRARLEKDLAKMNLDDGIDILFGAKVTEVETSEFDTPHNIGYLFLEDLTHRSCRWFVDATGRKSLLARKFGLHSKDRVPLNGSTWGRFKNVADFDSSGSAEWRNRAYGRFLSTNHFSGKGYWIWFIPLSGGHTSVGVVYEREHLDKPPRKEKEFLEFLNSHKAISELLKDAELVDIHAWGKLAYRADKFISDNRWATTGFAAMFLDPLFSGGGDMIAIMNDLICQQILKDLKTEDRTEAQNVLSTQAATSNMVAKEFYQSLYSHIANIYPVLDCGQLCSPLLGYSTAAYFVEAAWDYMAGNFSDLEYWKRKDYLRRGYLALELMLQRQTLSTINELGERGEYHVKNNTGFFDSGAEYYKYFVYLMGQQGRDGWRIELRTKLWTETFLKITGIKLGLENFASRRVVQEVLNFAEILNQPTLGKCELSELLEKLSQKLSEELSQLVEKPVVATVTEKSFQNGEVEFDNELIDNSELASIKAKASRIWNQTQEYIAMPSMVPVFLAFARNQPEDIMDCVIDQRVAQQ
ncbi:MAG: NAD(P)/FAD-dependent oxidoreductase [Kangiellaceae bacterium]|nr:NAD(P)/FAD-dependent oxidoreductase [Kangiellaceae bacterium]MCW8999001.1 NAD(P)/FAD-dependent oxidoreductase [Kangiellaceae bacterium]